MFSAVIDAKPLNDYKLHLLFKNGEEGIFDMRPYLDLEVFQPLKNLETFNAVRVSFDTVEWQDEIDIDPETLYAGCEKLITI